MDDLYISLCRKAGLDAITPSLQAVSACQAPVLVLPTNRQTKVVAVSQEKVETGGGYSALA